MHNATEGHRNLLRISSIFSGLKPRKHREIIGSRTQAKCLGRKKVLGKGKTMGKKSKRD